jgi:hypothetical protein
MHYLLLMELRYRKRFCPIASLAVDILFVPATRGHNSGIYIQTLIWKRKKGFDHR